MISRPRIARIARIDRAHAEWRGVYPPPADRIAAWSSGDLVCSRCMSPVLDLYCLWRSCRPAHWSSDLDRWADDGGRS